MRPIRRQRVEAHGVGGKDGVVLGVNVGGGARDVLTLRLDEGRALLAVGEVDVKQLRLKDVTIMLEAGREMETENDRATYYQ